MEGILCRGSLRRNVVNEALVYSSRGRRCRAEICMALGVVTAGSQTIPLRNQAAPYCTYVGLPSEWGFADGDCSLSSLFVGELLSWGLREIQINK